MAEGENVPIHPKTKVARIDTGSVNEFKFNFFDNKPTEDVAMDPKLMRDHALKALSRCDKDKLVLLIEKQYDFFSTGVWDNAIKMRRYSGIKYLLLKNYVMDKEIIRNTYNYAILNGATSLVRFILSNFKVFVKKNHSNYFHLACEHKRYKILRMMASEGFSANHVISYKNGRHQLHKAVLSSEIQMVKCLLRFKDLEINASDNYGNSPLHYALNFEIVKLLMKCEADPFQINLSGWDAITFAANSLKPSEVIQAMIPELCSRLEHFISNYKIFTVRFQRTFIISRERVLEDSFYLASRESRWYAKTSSFDISFQNETGIDHGGLTREWMSLLIERFFVPRLPEESEEDLQGEEQSSSGSSSSSSDEEAVEHEDILVVDESDTSNSSEDDSDSTEDGSGIWRSGVILPFNSDNYDQDEEHNSILDYIADYQSNFSGLGPLTNRVPVEDVELYYNAPFECVDAENKLYRISSKFTGPIDVYKFIGSIVAKSLVGRIPLKVKLVPSLIKLVLGRTLTFVDLFDDDPAMHRSMIECLNPEFDFEAACYTLPSDESVAVNADNVLLFLDETAVESMYLRQKERIDLFVSGFRTIIDHGKLQSYFSPSEIQEILKGSDKISRPELYKGIEISGFYWSANRTLFWNAMDLLQDGELIEFVRFVTGINGLPFGGVSALDKKIKIFDENRSSVPKASTCNYHLNLPISITTVPELVQMFRIAISSEPEFTDGC